VACRSGREIPAEEERIGREGGDDDVAGNVE
jgi:hypothetical protein